MYNLTQSNKSLLKDYGLVDQIRRASVSVVANISEGYYQKRLQSKRYLKISSGSANEVNTLLVIINKVYSIDVSILKEHYLRLAKQMSSYANSF